MNVKEYAEAKGISQDEVKKRFGLNHWKQQVPGFSDIESPANQEAEEAASVSDTIPTLIETESKQPSVESSPEPAQESGPSEVTTSEEKTEVIETKSKQEEDVDLEAVELSIRCLGNKSPLWKWRSKIGR